MLRESDTHTHTYEQHATVHLHVPSPIALRLPLCAEAPTRFAPPASEPIPADAIFREVRSNRNYTSIQYSTYAIHEVSCNI